MFNLEPVYVFPENISARALPFHTPGGGRNLSATVSQDHAPGQEGALSKLGGSRGPGGRSVSAQVRATASHT